MTSEKHMALQCQAFQKRDSLMKHSTIAFDKYGHVFYNSTIHLGWQQWQSDIFWGNTFEKKNSQSKILHHWDERRVNIQICTVTWSSKQVTKNALLKGNFPPSKERVPQITPLSSVWPSLVLLVQCQSLTRCCADRVEGPGGLTEYVHHADRTPYPHQAC